MNISEKAQAKALRKAEELRKQLEKNTDEIVKVYEDLGMEVYIWFKEGKIEVPQINDYLAKVDEVITNQDDKLKDRIICTCGTEVSRNSKFCNSCGKKVEDLIAEPSNAEQAPVKECICGAKIQPGQFMCLECGRKVE